MKLNYDCVRDIVLTVEETVSFDTIDIEPGTYKNYERLKDYDYEELAYNIHQCNQAGLFALYSETMSMTYMLGDLSPKGHEFAQNIKPEKTWKKILDKLKSIEVVGVSVLIEVAKRVIFSQMGL